MESLLRQRGVCEGLAFTNSPPILGLLLIKKKTLNTLENMTKKG